MALYIPHSIFHLAQLLYVRPETFGPYYVVEYTRINVQGCGEQQPNRRHNKTPATCQSFGVMPQYSRAATRPLSQVVSVFSKQTISFINWSAAIRFWHVSHVINEQLVFFSVSNRTSLRTYPALYCQAPMFLQPQRLPHRGHRSNGNHVNGAWLSHSR